MKDNKNFDDAAAFAFIGMFGVAVCVIVMLIRSLLGIG